MLRGDEPRQPDADFRAALTFLFGHFIAGVAGALVTGGLVLWFDVAGLGTLIRRSDQPWLAAALMLFGLAVTFGGCALAAGVMGMKNWRRGG